MEVWKDISGYEGLYQVSDKGRVKSLHYGKERILKQINLKWYNRACLSKDGKMNLFLVHRLVAEAFLPNPNNFNLINHKDENPSNNNIENLEWCNYEYNNNYGTRNKRISKSNTNGKLSKNIIQYSLDGTFIKEWSSMSQITRELGFYHGGISACCRGVYNKAYGYIWKFKEVV